MGQVIPSPLFAALLGLTLLVIVLSIFAWRWAVQRPVASPEASAAPPPPVYAAVGASDVVGVGADDPSTQSWVNKVHGLMPAGARMVRLGRSGITLHEALQIEIPQAVEAQPDVVTIWNCVNDATALTPLPDYTADLRRALDALTKRTHARVFVLNLPDLSLLDRYSADDTQRELVRGGVLQWNRAIEETVRAYGDRASVIDLFDVSQEAADHPEYISVDGFHPSTAGYRRLGEYVFSVISAEWSPAAGPVSTPPIEARP